MGWFHSYRDVVTFHRLWNSVCCYGSYLLSLLGIVKVRHRPLFISVEPANWCMLRCPQCPVGMRQDRKEEHRFFTAEMLEKVLQETGKYLQTVLFHFQGEPLLNQQLPELIRLAKQEKIYTMLSTNAQLLDESMAKRLVESGLDRVVVSIDGFTQASYEQYRVGGSLKRALAGLQFMHRAKTKYHSPIVIELQCLYLRSNEQEWNYIRQNYRALGATKLSMKTAQFYDFEGGNALMPTNEKYSRYHKGKDGVWRLKKKIRNRCYRMWSGCVIDAAGDVHPCCFDKDGKYVYGNIRCTGFLEIWNGERAMQLRKKIVEKRKDIPMCNNCTQ